MYGNNSDSDSDYKEGYSPQAGRSDRRHQKKKNRGTRRTVAQRNTTCIVAAVEAPPKKRRVFIPNKTKLRAIDEFERLLATLSWDAARDTFGLVFPAVTFSQMLKWRRRVDILRADVAHSRSMAMKLVSAQSCNTRGEQWFPEAEALVFSELREARSNGLQITGMWVSAKMRDALAQLIPDGSADDFVAGGSWRTKFYHRFGLSTRTATNVVPESLEERVPRCLNFFHVIQQVCAKDGGMNLEWGRFPPHHRFNADEVPVEFGGALGRTVTVKGEKRVWVTAPKHKVEQRECTFLPLFCAGKAILFSSIFLRCAPKKLADGTVNPRAAAHVYTNELIGELRMEHPNVDIYCQQKGYMDGITFLTWFKETFLPTVGNSNQLLVLDNLTAHATDEIREFAAQHGVCLLFSPPNCTDMIQVTDYGLGRAIKHKMKAKFTAHFSAPANISRWQKGTVSPAERKRLHVQWLSEATTEFYTGGGQTTVEKVFGHCGLRTPLHEQGEQLRKIQGYDGEIRTDWQ